MSSEKPPTFTISTPETPLDLTLRRLDTNDEYTDNLSYPRTMVRHMSLPSDLEFHTNPQYNQYNSSPQYTDDRTDTSRPTETPSPPSTHSVLSLSPPTNSSRSTTTSPAPYSDDGYTDKRESDSPKFDCFILPKKRKNLWRPYDSRAVACGELDRDSDSSDSTASVSDQEFKTPAMDPVKKRKLNMIQYMSNDTSKQQSETIKRPVDETDQSLDNKSSHVNENIQSSPGKFESSKMSHQTESTPGYFSHMAEELTKSHMSLLNSYPDAREKMISGLKKRDIFGWGLKLTKPPPECQQVPEAKAEPNSSQNSQNVCQDGEKTYIELQTVRPNTSSQPAQTEGRITEVPTSEKSPFKVPKNDVLKPNTSPCTVQSKPNTPEKTSAKSPEKTSEKSYDNEKENRDVNENGKIYVQTRDNVIKTFDESKNVPVKKRKEISLIDLVEEIEATAMRLEEEDESIKNKRNRRVTALLDQCNHVKLQALDFLMANVLIQDKEPHYKQKNEKVQKMLKGDKIGTVNMLDVLELQVEIGLN